jgi:hypothetical protein
VWLNIKNFKMPKTLANRFVLKYACLYKIICKPHFDVYILQLLTTLVAHSTFHVSKLKLVHEDKKRKDHKHAYHARFNHIEHKLVEEAECILATR